MEPTETTLTGNRMWIIVGILAFVAILILVGIYNQPAREYVHAAVKTCLALIPVIR
jgi:cytochrome c-type biogenesis protein CcmE